MLGIPPYELAHLAYAKLKAHAARSDIKLRIVLGHAILADTLLLDLNAVIIAGPGAGGEFLEDDVPSGRRLHRTKTHTHDAVEADKDEDAEFESFFGTQATSTRRADSGNETSAVDITCTLASD